MTSSPDRLWIPPELLRAPRAAAAPAASAASANGAWHLPEFDGPGTALATAPGPTEADEAYERGVMDGAREGEARARQDLEPALEAVTRVSESFEIIAQAWVMDRERDLQGLALAVARKLVQRELTADPGVVSDLVTRALELMPTETALEIHINPLDLAMVSEELERTSSGTTAAPRWVADPTVARGDFMVESPMRIVDGRTDVALRSLYDRLDPS